MDYKTDKTDSIGAAGPHAATQPSLGGAGHGRATDKTPQQRFGSALLTAHRACRHRRCPRSASGVLHEVALSRLLPRLGVGLRCAQMLAVMQLHIFHSGDGPVMKSVVFVGWGTLVSKETLEILPVTRGTHGTVPIPRTALILADT